MRKPTVVLGECRSFCSTYPHTRENVAATLGWPCGSPTALVYLQANNAEPSQQSRSDVRAGLSLQTAQRVTCLHPDVALNDASRLAASEHVLQKREKTRQMLTNAHSLHLSTSVTHCCWDQPALAGSAWVRTISVVLPAPVSPIRAVNTLGRNAPLAS